MVSALSQWHWEIVFHEAAITSTSPESTGTKLLLCHDIIAVMIVYIWLCIVNLWLSMYRNVPIRSALPNRSAPKRICKLSQISSPPHKIEASEAPQLNVLAPGTSYMNFMESLLKYIPVIQTRHVLLEITMAATTTWFTSEGLGRKLLVWFSWSPELFKQSCGSNTL